MRSFLILCLSLLASLSWASTTIDCTSVNQVTATMAITSTEDTLILTVASSSSQIRTVQIVCDQAWGIGTTTGAFSTKVPIAATQPISLRLQASSQSFKVQAASTSGTLHIIVLDNQ